MINPINLIKLDDVRDGDGKTFHIGQLPDYDQEDYDLSNNKDFESFIRDVKSEVRQSFEYREMIKYLKEYGGMDRSGLNPNISNIDGNRVKIEIHHTPFTIEDIIRIIFEKRRFYHEDLSVQMVAKEVMECHYKGLVGLFPLSATEHELVHSGYLFIPPSRVFGNYKQFMTDYEEFVEEEMKEIIDQIEKYEEDFNAQEQQQLLAQSNIYLDPNGAYKLPQLDDLRQNMSNRIYYIKDNMYMLPVLDERIPTSPTMKEAIYFTNDKGERIDEPIS